MGMSDDAYVLGAIVLLVLVSLITRSVYFVFGDYLPLTDPVRRALRYAPVAALTAIVVPELLPWGAGVGGLAGIPLLAAVAGVLAYVRTRNTLMVIVVGMLAYWVLGALK